MCKNKEKVVIESGLTEEELKQRLLGGFFES